MLHFSELSRLKTATLSYQKLFINQTLPSKRPNYQIISPPYRELLLSARENDQNEPRQRQSRRNIVVGSLALREPGPTWCMRITEENLEYKDSDLLLLNSIINQILKVLFQTMVKSGLSN